MINSLPETTKSVIDLGSISLALMAILEAVPHLAAIASLAWALIRLYETKTVQGWLRKNNRNRRQGDRDGKSTSSRGS